MPESGGRKSGRPLLVSGLERNGVAVPASATPEEAQSVMLNTGFLRIPVHADDIDQRRTATDPAASVASAMRSYRDPARMRFLKLADGGLTDNQGLTSNATITSSQAGWRQYIKNAVARRAATAVCQL